MSQIRGKQRQTYRLTDLIDPPGNRTYRRREDGRNRRPNKAVAAWVSAVLPHLAQTSVKSSTRCSPVITTLPSRRGYARAQSPFGPSDEARVGSMLHSEEVAPLREWNQ